MLYSNSVQDTRRIFHLSWQKYKQNKSLEPLERQLIAVIKDHPEYHALLENAEEFSKQEFFPELGQTNPFLHMGLHLALRDQLSTDRPIGVVHCFHSLMKKYDDQFIVEHLMMECLAESLWLAQRNNGLPDEKQYLTALKKL